MIVSFTPKQWASWVKKLGEDFKPAALRGIRSGALRCVTLMERRTMTVPPITSKQSTGVFNTGLYMAAWKQEALPEGARLYNDRPYAGVIDYGRRASPVNAAGRRNIAAWAYHKLKLTREEAEAAAWAIAGAQQKKQRYGRRVMSGAMTEMTQLVSDEILHELKEAMRHAR